MNKVFFGDCRDSMRQLIADGVKVQMCVTSPPYFGLRDYGRTGQIGLEDKPEEFVAVMVEVFDLVRELLTDDGVLWLNLGDSYNAYNGGAGPGSKLSKTQTEQRPKLSTGYGLQVKSLKPKDLIGIPWRVAFALQAAGWYLRQDIIWHKPNPMPESVTDRCTKSHEYMFLLAKSERYYYDHEAIKEKAVADHLPGNKKHKHASAYEEGDNKYRTKAGLVDYSNRKALRSNTESRHRNSIEGGQTLQEEPDGRRNKRSVWTIPTQPYSGAHFAVFPEALVEPCVLAGSRAGDIVLDPFFGSGTTGQVSQRLGRQWIGCELNQDYEELQNHRVSQTGFIF